MRRSALALATLLAGCAGIRPVAPADLNVKPPVAWRTATTPDVGLLDAQWWEGFDDPVLADVVEHALANNVDVSIAAARVEEARAQFRLARGQELPTVDLVGGGGPQRAPNAFGIDTSQTAGQAEVSVAYDLDLFGRLRNSTAAARASFLATRSAQDSVRLAVASAAASGYLTLRALDERLAIVRDTLVSRETELKLVTRRADAGYASKLELYQADAEYRTAQQQIPAIELAIRRQEDGLNLLLGETPHAIDRGRELFAIAVPSTPVALPSAVLRQRPDIAQAEYQVVAADRTLDAARAAFLPTIRLSAAGGFVGSTLLADPVSIFSLGASVLAPLFEGGKLKAQRDVATSRRDQAALAYRRTALTAFREVEDSLAAIDRLGEQEARLVSQRDVLAAAYQLANNRYRAGYSSQLELLDAERALLSARLATAQVRADRLTAIVGLCQALGGGWDAATIERAKP